MSFTIQVQEDPPLLRVVMRGFWDMATFDAYMAECGQAIQRLMARHGRFDTLGDCTDFPIQGADVSAAFQKLREATDLTPRNRIAIYSRSALGRTQAERTVGNGHTRIFNSEQAALEWLAEPPPAA